MNVFFDDLTIMQTGLHTVEATDYYPFGLVMSRYRTEKYGYGYQGQFSEEDEETGWNSFELRQYDPVIARWLSPDPYGQFSSPYLAMGNNPGMVDPDGGFAFPRLDLSFLNDAPAWTTTMGNIIINGGTALEFGGFTGAMSIAGAASSTISSIANINSFNKMVPINSQISMHQGNLDFGNSGTSGGSVQQAGFGDYLLPTEKHYNGSLGLIGAAVGGYNKIPNRVKRHYAHKLSKGTGVKSGKIFQGTKAFANNTGKLASKLGPMGTALTIGVITYEVGTKTWDAHTIVNGTLLIGAGVATFFAAPVVLTGIAAYGIGDYFFDFSGSIDATVGRDSGIW